MTKKIVTVFFVFFIFVNIFAEQIGKTDNEVKLIANPILKNILDGLKNKDVEKFRRDFDDTMKNAFPKKTGAESIKQIYDQVGDHLSLKYPKFLQQNKYMC